MRATWRRVGNVIVVIAEGREYRFDWRDADMAAALYLGYLKAS